MSPLHPRPHPMSAHISERFHMQPDEAVILKFRKHWFILFQATVGTIIVSAIPFVIFGVFKNIGVIPPDVIAPAAVTFASALWFLLIWLSLAVIWTNYYLDLWIVTDRRIMNIEQVTLFNREVTTWRMERVQEVTITQRNFIETFLDFGTIEVETAGPSDEFAIIRGIPHPELVQRTILGQIDLFTEHHNAHTGAYEKTAHDTHSTDQI